MKNLLLLIIVVGINISFAVPLVYTFSGVITSNTDYDASGLLRANNIQSGESLEYKMLVDFERNGEFVGSDGSLQYYNEADYGNIYDLYFSKYLSGTPFVDLINGNHYRPTLEESYSPPHELIRNVGLNVVANFNGPIKSRLFSNPSPYGALTLTSYNSYFNEMQIGDSLVMRENTGNPYFIETNASIGGTLILSSIETYNAPAVPEPSSAIMISIGFVMMFFICRNKISNTCVEP